MNDKSTPQNSRRVFFRRRKSCLFCDPGSPKLDYKDSRLLSKFISERGRIAARRMSGVCAKHQRDLATACKRARQIAVLPYVIK